jgi:16S rRNA (guanine527-N7)-methyltransferase
VRLDLEAVLGRNVPRETIDQLEHFEALLIAENDQQNLVSKSTIEDLWNRHIIDSAQLLRHVPADAAWIDIGSGAGIPGVVLGILGVRSIRLVEPRRLRAQFLAECLAALALERNVSVEAVSIAHVRGTADVITARAVASVDKLFTLAAHAATLRTQWVLPKGRSGLKEVADAELNWQGRFRTEPSMTDPEAVIVLATEVRAKHRGRGAARA